MRSGWQKNSISICSNSRERKVKLRGVISLRKLLPIWAIPKGNLDPRAVDHILEVHENPLGRFGSQERRPFFAAERSDVGLEHQIEFARFGEGAQVVGIGPSTSERSSTFIERLQRAVPRSLSASLARS
jgi:hypothetical protein